MVEVIKEVITVRGRTVSTYSPVIVQKRSDSIITQNDAYTIKELFQRHMAGNQITCSKNEDSGNGATCFEEMNVLDYLDRDLTDLDVISDYVKDYKKRYKSLKLKENGKQQQTTSDTPKKD